MSSFAQRMIGAAKLDATTYEEVEADTGATMQAMLVVVLANVAMALGTWGATTGGNILQPLIGALVSWFVFAVSVYLVGAKLLKEPQTSADVPQLLRTIGFASSPLILNVLAFIPFLGILTFPITGIWSLAATIIAVRQALDYTSTARAVIVSVIGFLIFIGVRATIALLTGGAI